jgi:hypothetical protein
MYAVEWHGAVRLAAGGVKIRAVQEEPRKQARCSGESTGRAGSGACARMIDASEHRDPHHLIDRHENPSQREHKPECYCFVLRVQTRRVVKLSSARRQ